MALKEEIDAAHELALLRLIQAHDYSTYTKSAWRTLLEMINHGGLKLTMRSAATSAKIGEQDLLKLSQRYVTDELASSTLQQFVSIFENFLEDVLHAWLRAFPDSLAKKQLTGKEILNLPDKDAIINALAAKELRDVFYDRPAYWFEYLNKCVKLSVPTANEIQQFAEIKATRDILVHGRGVANALYFEKAGSAARVPLGDPLDIPDQYHQQSWNLICKMISEIGNGMAAKA